jgi:hypothetical protein
MSLLKSKRNRRCAARISLKRTSLRFEPLEERDLLSLTIAAENALQGTPQSVWNIPNNIVDSSIEGYATDMSVDHGQTVNFKINTPASSYHVDIYRLGYYGGNGARLVTTLSSHIASANNQPSPIIDVSTGLADAGNWRVTDRWNVPADATSGIYFARMARDDGGGTTGVNGFAFVVRDDEGESDMLFQTSDTTWQAYNPWGGANFYGDYGIGTAAGRAYKISYNRPITDVTIVDQVFWSEYPMVRWLESNGYNVSYSSGMDTDRLGGNLLQHKVFMSVGHDEYWSGGQRANVEAARDAGVNLAFFSGNECYWKTRWENSVDGSNTPYRTLVCYKETWGNAKIDPMPNVWTGTWRDPRFSPPADGGRPENGLTGTIFMAQDFYDSITVPALQGQTRFWRNTSVANLAPGQVAVLTANTLGYEFDSDLDNGFRPAGLIDLATTPEVVGEKLLDYGNTVGPGTVTHNSTLYRAATAPAGKTKALVFAAGTIQWAWGLDGNHTGASSVADPRMQQATVNLFADMGVQPATLQANLVPATASTDTIAPTSAITFPQSNSIVQTNSSIVIQGTATDNGGGIVAGVEVSTDGGTTWHPAVMGQNGAWTYTWAPTLGVHTIRSRASDDSVNLETPSAGVTINVLADSVTAPQLSNISFTVIDPFTASVNWTSDESSTSVVHYGTTTNTPNTASTTGMTTNHSVTLTGLTPGTIYYFRVESGDASGNVTIQPTAANSPLQLVTHTTYIDTTTADFSAGTPGANTSIISQVSPLNNGGVSLAPTAGSEFTGTTLPAGWTSTAWNTGGTATVSGGSLQADGVRAYTTATFNAGRSLEFMATFSGDASQHIGFGVDFNTQPWAIFSTGGGGILNVRTNNGSGELSTTISNSLLGSPHLFRIDWNSTNVVYSVDGAVVATHAVAISTAMRPIVSDYATGASVLQVDWLRMGPFATSGSFMSQVFDGGASVVWGTASWTAATPSGTSVALLVRTGNTPTPDGTWTNFVPVASSGATIGVTSRYLQYRADLTTNSPGNPDAMPSLNDVTITFTPAASTTLANSGPVAEGSPVNVNFTVPNDPGNLHYSFALTQAGLATTYATAGTAKNTSFTFNDNGSFTVFGRVFNPDNSFNDYTTVVTVTNVAPTATLGNNGPVNASSPVTVSFTNPTDVSSADVTAGFHYSFALTAGGLATTYASAGTSTSQAFTFTTGGSFTVFGRIFDKDNGFTDYTTSVTVNGPTALTDTTVADFTAGTPDANTSIVSQVSPANNGGVSLAPAAGSEFTGTALPSGWTSTVWNTGGAATVSGGLLSVDGVRAYTTATFSAGRSLEFMATFSSDAFQHIGFGVDFNAGPWAIFSTSSGGGLNVRTNNGTSELSTAISSSFLNSPHLFRIDWNSANVVYSVDGTVVATHTATISTAMRPIVSDFTTGGGNVQVDWLRMGPFAASGSFTSRVFDGGASVAWGAASWTTTTPSGTSVALFVRTGNTPTPDGTWTNFISVASSGASIGVTARYLQYRADLTTNSPANPDAMPTLSDVTLVYNTALTPTLGNSGPVAEGSPVTVGFTVPNDPGNLHYSFALTQAGLPTTYATAGASKNTSFTFNDNGSFTVFGRVFNPDNSFTDYTTTVTVTNVAPTATLGNNGPVNANAPVTVSFTNPADVSSADVTAGFHYSFALTAGGLAANYAAAGTSTSQAFTFATGGSFTVFGRIFDKDNGFTDYTTSVTVVGPTTLVDTTGADFSAGTPGTNTSVISQVNPLNNGAVTLAPAGGSEFTGTTLPADWTSTAWNTGGAATVNGGSLSVDGVRAYTTATFSAGRSVEFMATFSGDAFQHVGFGVDFNAQPWAIFSTSSGGGLNVRTNNGTSNLTTAISSSFLGSPHLFRIDWNAANVVYSVDGTVVATHAVAISTAMRPIVSDFTTGGGNVQVDWLRMGPFAASGSFTSRVFDGGASVAWGTASWTATTPAGTSVALFVRTGNTPTPDGTWTNFVPVASPGASIGVTARYLQYRADLTTNSPANPDVMPILNDVSLTYSPVVGATLAANAATLFTVAPTLNAATLTPLGSPPVATTKVAATASSAIAPAGLDALMQQIAERRIGTQNSVAVKNSLHDAIFTSLA